MGEDELREDGEKEIEEDKGGAEVKVDAIRRRKRMMYP